LFLSDINGVEKIQESFAKST